MKHASEYNRTLKHVRSGIVVAANHPIACRTTEHCRHEPSEARHAIFYGGIDSSVINEAGNVVRHKQHTHMIRRQEIVFQ